jgi:hypothetical protein
MAAPKGNKFAEGIGRPEKYTKEHDNIVYKICLLGATDKEIADFFEVEESTINNWKNKYPSFLESLKRGKEIADITIAESLYERAKGCSIEKEVAIKLKKHKQIGDRIVADEEVEIISLTEQMPPDTTALIFWLKNRKSTRWRDKTEIDHSTLGERIEFFILPASKKDDKT